MATKLIYSESTGDVTHAKSGRVVAELFDGRNGKPFEKTDLAAHRLGRMFAAAPDMLAALKRINNCADIRQSLALDHLSLLQKIQAAIEKACEHEQREN
jgi:hypothetical protein